MKLMHLVIVAGVLGSAVALGVPVDTPKKTDPYDEDLVRALKPLDELRKGDVSERRQAITRLGKLVDSVRNLRNALSHRLIDPDEVVRIKAAQALADMGPSAREGNAVWDLAQALADPNEDVRYWSARALGVIGPPPVVYYPGTNRYLNKYLEIETAVAALTRALKDKSKKVRLEAAWALGKQGPFAKPAVPALLNAMREDDAKDEKTVAEGGSLRFRAISALGLIGPEAKEAIPALLEAVKNGETLYVRGRAIGALGTIAAEDAQVFPVLLAAVKDKKLRRAALMALGNVDQRHVDRVVPIFVKALDVSDIEDQFQADMVQDIAIGMLMQMGPAAKKAALPKIEEILQNPKTGSAARRAAEQAVERMRR